MRLALAAGAVITGLVAGVLVAHAQKAAPQWDVRVPERLDVAQGAIGELSVTVAVDRGLVVSKDASVIVDLVAPPGVMIKKKRLGRPDAVDPEADAPRFSAPIRAESVGDHAVTVRVRFWVCGGKACRPVDLKRTANVVVTAPAVPSDAGID